MCLWCFDEPLAFTQVSVKCKKSHQSNQCIDILSLQNTQFCIDNGNANPPQHYQHDSLTLMDFMNEQDSDDPRPLGLLGGGEHFIDIPEGRHGATQRSQRLARQESSNRTNPIVTCYNMSLQGTCTVQDHLIHNTII